MPTPSGPKHKSPTPAPKLAGGQKAEPAADPPKASSKAKGKTPVHSNWAGKGQRCPKPKPKHEGPPVSSVPSKSGEVRGNLPYDMAWKDYSAARKLEVDHRPGAENKRRDRIARRVPQGGCILLCFLAHARDARTLEWVDALLGGGNVPALELPVAKDKAVSLIERFCMLEGVRVRVYEARSDAKGNIQRKYIQDFGEEQGPEVLFLRVPTIFRNTEGQVVAGHHLLPVRKLNLKDNFSTEILFKSLPCAADIEEVLEVPPLGEASSSSTAACPPKPKNPVVPKDAKVGIQAFEGSGWISAEGALGGPSLAAPCGAKVTTPEVSGALTADDMSGGKVPVPEVNRRQEDEKLHWLMAEGAALADLYCSVPDWPRLAGIAEQKRAGRGTPAERSRRRLANSTGPLQGELAEVQALDLECGLGLPGEPVVHPEPEEAATEGPISCPTAYPRFNPDPVYEGAWDPGCYVRWKSGWFASCKPTVTHRFAALFQAPDLCSASLEQASRWLDQCWYVPYTDGTHFVHGSGKLICNGQMAEKFEEGDVLVLHGRRYRVRSQWWAMSNVGAEGLIRVGCWREASNLSGRFIAKKLFSLELADEGLFAGCSDGILDVAHLRWLVARSDPQAAVERPIPTLPTEEVDMKVGYGLMLSRAPDECQPLAVVIRNDAAMRKWKVKDGAALPHLAERHIHGVMCDSDHQGWGYAGGQNFDWGYCYSCGKKPPGRFPGRLCSKNSCVNGTKSARMTAYGYQAVKPGSIVYPGVIQNIGQFPPLKTSVNTVATAETLSGVPLDKEALRAMPMEQQPAARLGGIGFGGAIPFSFAKGPGILGAALAYRAFRDVDISVEPEVFRKIAGFNWLLMPGFCLPKQEWELDYWLGSMPMRRRKPLRQAHERRLQRGEDHKDYEWFNPFVKDEHALYGAVLDGLVTAETVEAIPRNIFAPHDETHLDAGRYLKPLVGDLKSIWNHENWLFYASCKPELLDLWLNKNKDARSFFCSDYSAFERSHSHPSWDYMEGIYRQIYPHADEQFWKALKAWRVPKGKKKMPKFDAKIEFHADCMNASGRDDTGLSNAILNGMGLAFSFAAALGNKTVLEVEVDDIRRASELVQIAVMGDDSLVACSFDVEPYREAILRELRRFGFVVKAVTTPNLHDVTFLGMMPYPVAGRFYWGPTIGRRMYKAFWQHDPKGNLPAWTHGAAKQLALNACVPIVSDCAERVMAILAGKKATKIAPENEGYGSAWTLRDTATPRYDESTLRWLCQRYPGLELSAIRSDVKNIARVQRLPALIRLNTTDLAFALDEM